MSTEAKRYTGGCLCGALRYAAVGESIGSGRCYCSDCRRTSGSGFIPFMGFKADSVRFTGEAREFRSKAANGGDAVLNRCSACLSLLFGGEIDKTDSYTLYAGSLDDPSAFHPTFAIFAKGRPHRPSSRPVSRFSIGRRPRAKPDGLLRRRAAPGGKRSHTGRPGKDRSPRQSRLSIASAK